MLTHAILPEDQSHPVEDLPGGRGTTSSSRGPPPRTVEDPTLNRGPTYPNFEDLPQQKVPHQQRTGVHQAI